MDDHVPVIGVSGTIVLDTNGRFPGYNRAYVNEAYVHAVLHAGGIPLIIPMHSEDNISALKMEKLDGLILTGGEDVNPLFYQEEPLQKQGNHLYERDIFEQQLIHAAIQRNKPILAICRGMQILNVTLKGTMYQDISYMKAEHLRHDQNTNPERGTHTVYFDHNSFIFELFGEKTVTNSFHHQAIKQVAPGLKVTGRTEDGVIESVEKCDDHQFMIGLQWHPEMMYKQDEKMARLFKVFIEKAVAFKQY